MYTNNFILISTCCVFVFPYSFVQIWNYVMQFHLYIFDTIALFHWYKYESGWMKQQLKVFLCCRWATVFVYLLALSLASSRINHIKSTLTPQWASYFDYFLLLHFCAIISCEFSSCRSNCFHFHVSVFCTCKHTLLSFSVSRNIFHFKCNTSAVFTACGHELCIELIRIECIHWVVGWC